MSESGFKCQHIFILYFYFSPDLGDAEAGVPESNPGGAEHRHVQEHRGGPSRHAAVHGAGYLCGAASVGAARRGRQRSVGNPVFFLSNNLLISVYSLLLCFSSSGRVVDIYSKFDVIVSCRLFVCLSFLHSS